MEGKRTPSLQYCLELLQGQTEEERLRGLHLVTEVCQGDDRSSLRNIYKTIGVGFLDHLLRAGMVRRSPNGSDNHDAYLQLSLTVIATFCRVPEIASSSDMFSKVPMILEIMSKSFGSLVLEECYEVLYLVLSASEDGGVSFFRSEGLKLFAPQVATLADGSRSMELAMKIVQLLLGKLSSNNISKSCLEELSSIVIVIARQFAVLHNALKFEALHLLSAIFFSENLVPLREFLCSLSNRSWSSDLRIGIMAILQNGAAPAETLHALLLVDVLVSILGERWLINLPEAEEPIPADRCLILVMEASSVQITVSLNNLAYLKYEAPTSSCWLDLAHSKQQNLAITFSLIEKVIRLAATVDGEEDSLIDETTLIKVISGLNETIGGVLRYLKDAKEYADKKGDDLLASVRVVGSYLAEAPMAYKNEVQELLPYMLSVEGNDEPRPFHCVCFLLPMLCQMTMEIEGCGILVSFDGDKAVAECLSKLIDTNACMEDNHECSIFLACNTMINVLLKVDLLLDAPVYANLLKSLACWAGNANGTYVRMIASSICSLVFDHTSEKALRRCSFDLCDLDSVSRLIARGLTANKEDVHNDGELQYLRRIVASGFSHWAHRFPRVKHQVKREIGR